LVTDYGIPETVLEPLYAALGELIFSWALVEANVNYWMAVNYQRAGGKHLEKWKTMPPGMTRKLRFLRLCFKTIPALEPFRATGIDLISRIKMVVKVRDIVAHGVVAEYKLENHSFLFIRFDLNQEKTMQRFNESWLTIQQILDSSGKAIALGREGLNFTGDLLKAFITDEEMHELFGGLKGT
jgi:hypothetical protein